MEECLIMWKDVNLFQNNTKNLFSVAFAKKLL